MHRKLTSGMNKHGRHIITQSKKGKDMHEAIQHLETHIKW